MIIFVTLLSIAFYLLVAGAYFSLAQKAGLDGIAWFAFIPILNVILQLKMIRQSAWMVLLTLIPIVNIIFMIIWQVNLLNAFGKSGAFVLFAIFLAPVYTILWIVWGYSSSTTYQLGNPMPPNGPTAAF